MTTKWSDWLDEDPLALARGIAYAVWVSAALWVLVIAGLLFFTDLFGVFS
jgi:multidrug transporter EmrE-like cation transporter